MRVVFRADGNAQIGLGHVYRSCALASMIGSYFHCVFVIINPNPSLREEISRHCAEIIELPEFADGAEDVMALAEIVSAQPCIVVLDGYQFDASYQKQLKQIAPCALLSIDDIHQTHFYADVLLNQAGNARHADYNAEPYTQFFLGTKYCLLRSEFLKRRPRLAEANRRLLVSFGGADPRNDTLQVIKYLGLPEGIDSIHVMIGSGYLYKDDLIAYIAENKLPVRLYQNLTAAEVADLMQYCGQAIISPSGVAYEYLSTGGLLHLRQIADNQAGIYSHLLDSGAAVDWTQFGSLSQYQQTKMHECQQQILDGQSPERMLQLFNCLSLIVGSKIRKMQQTDMQQTFLWANDPLVRQMSYCHDSILPQDHEQWFLEKMEDPAISYYIFETENRPFAQIRFEKKDDNALLSYAIDADFRGKGLGSFIIAEGLKRLKQDLAMPLLHVIGYVKSDNVASCLSFERMKFTKVVATEYPESFKYTIEL